MERNLRENLKKHGFVFKKAYGQNFLTDKALLDEIVEKALITEDTEVLEIGCGAGALTSALARKAKKVIGYEIDEKLKPILRENLREYDNVEINFMDVMKEKIENVEKNFSSEYVLCANLPYYITTPIVMEFLEKAKKLKSMVIMVQEEVALRFSAKSGTSDYGAITVAIDLRGKAEILLRVNREKFTPVPNVDSAVVKIDVIKGKTDGVDLASVRDLVRCAFSSRRKMLVNNIINAYKMSRSEVEDALTRAQIDLTTRGEALNAQEFIRLSQELKGKNNEKDISSSKWKRP